MIRRLWERYKQWAALHDPAYIQAVALRMLMETDPMLNAYQDFRTDKVAACVDGRYVPARPYVGPGGFLGLHWREAWQVLTGQRHAVEFPGQER